MFDHAAFCRRLSQQPTHRQSIIKDAAIERLFDRLSFIKNIPKTIYVEGYQPEIFWQHLTSLYPEAQIMQSLQQPVDLILSNFYIHQVQHIPTQLNHFYTNLNPGGWLMFITFGSSSLSTWQKAWRSLDGCPHHNALIDTPQWGDLLVEHKFETPVVDAQMLYLTYEQPKTMIQDLRQLNEPLADTKMRHTLTGKNRWHKLVCKMGKPLQLEFEFVFGYGIRPKNLTTKHQDNQPAKIELNQLKAHLKQQS